MLPRFFLFVLYCLIARFTNIYIYNERVITSSNPALKLEVGGLKSQISAYHKNEMMIEDDEGNTLNSEMDNVGKPFLSAHKTNNSHWKEPKEYSVKPKSAHDIESFSPTLNLCQAIDVCVATDIFDCTCDGVLNFQRIFAK